MKGNFPGRFKVKVLGQLGDGGSILDVRGDGWGLRDSEGWCRYRCCRRVNAYGRALADQEKGSVGLEGDLDITRYTRAFTRGGRRCGVRLHNHARTDAPHRAPRDRASSKHCRHSVLFNMVR